jgi:glycosyltransferase involved in cell wall biosynthesis
MKKTIFLYGTPVIRCQNTYYAKFMNYIDLLMELANKNDGYQLALPCKKVTEKPTDHYEIKLPDNIIELSYYQGHHQAIFFSFVNAIRLLLIINKQERDRKLIVAGPGPNSFMFWLTKLGPKTIKPCFFIRGDTLKTVEYIYKNKFLLNKITSWAVKLFQRRIIKLLRESRATVFVFGDKLLSKYKGFEQLVHVISPLIQDDFVRSDERPNIPKESPLRILFVGRFSAEKNLFSLIEACDLANKAGNPFFLNLAGTGPLEKKISIFLEENPGSKNYVKLKGFISDPESMKALYDSNDILCLPSMTEGIPSVVIEAFAREMPVIATPVGSLPNLFPDQIRFCPGFTGNDLYESIKWSDNNRDILSRMGKEGRKGIDKFLISENAKKIDGIISNL